MGASSENVGQIKRTKSASSSGSQSSSHRDDTCKVSPSQHGNSDEFGKKIKRAEKQRVYRERIRMRREADLLEKERLRTSNQKLEIENSEIRSVVNEMQRELEAFEPGRKYRVTMQRSYAPDYTSYPIVVSDWGAPAPCQQHPSKNGNRTDLADQSAFSLKSPGSGSPESCSWASNQTWGNGHWTNQNPSSHHHPSHTYYYPPVYPSNPHHNHYAHSSENAVNGQPYVDRDRHEKSKPFYYPIRETGDRWEMFRNGPTCQATYWA